jgi:hypothetical protein
MSVNNKLPLKRFAEILILFEERYQPSAEIERLTS